MFLIEQPFRPSAPNLLDSCVEAVVKALCPPEEDEPPRVLLEDLWIRTKEKKLVRFEPNSVQEKYLDELSAAYPPQYEEIDGQVVCTRAGFDWRNGQYTLRGIREDILKARQQGMSTLWLALYFLDTINNPLTQSIIIAHDAPTTELLFQIIHRFYLNLPPEKKRPKKYSSKREIRFADIDSVIYVGTAGAPNLGRSQTINNVHMSERAFWINGGEVEVGLLESVPKEGNVTRETTANGLNDYYLERMEIDDGKSKYVGRFFGWNEMQEYRLPVPASFERTPEEQRLVEAYGIDDEELAWRRDKLKSQKKKFTQEYPISIAEAFLSSGNPYFNRALLKEILDRLTGKETAADYAPLPGDMVVVPPRFDFNRKADGWQGRALLSPYLISDDGAPPDLQIWDLPVAGRHYIISADTAEGINDRGDHDYDSADVWDAETWQQVAHLHCRMADPTEYGLMLAALGWWYNEALIGVERNNHGHTVLSCLQHIAGYPLMTQTRDMRHGIYEHQEYDENLRPTAMRAGYPTTAKSKPISLDGLNTSINNREIRIRSVRTIMELMTYIKLPNNKSGAESGHDDCVSSAAIGDALLKMRPLSTTTVAPMPDYDDAKDPAVIEAEFRASQAHGALPPEIAEHLQRLKGEFRR